MRSLSVRQKALLSLGVGAWAMGFALHLGGQLQGQLAWLPVVVEASADGPVVSGFWSPDDAARSGLALGDRVLEIDGAPVAKDGTPIGFVTTVYAAQREGRVSLRVSRDGTPREAELALVPIASRWVATIVSLVFAATGALVYVRARATAVATFAFGAFIAYAMHWAYFFGGPPARTLAGIGVLGGSLSLAFPLGIRALSVFPAEVARVGAVHRFGPWLLALGGVGASSWAFGVPWPSELGFRLNLAASVAFLLWAALAVTWSARHAGPDGRRQLKWVVLGFYVAFAPMAVTAFAAALAPRWWPIYEASAVAAIAIPICVWIAITRDRLFDIDTAITRAASYTAVSVALLAAALLAAPRAASLTEAWVEPRVAELGFAGAFAGGILWARRRLEPRLDRFFFRGQETLEAEIRSLGAELSRYEKPWDLLDRVGTRLDELFEPTSAAIYAAADGVYAPCFARGAAIAPAFAADGPLVQVLELADGPLPIERLRRTLGRLGSPSGAESLAALDTMGVELLVPLATADGLEAFVALGDKRSGDVYRDADRAHLALLQARCGEALAELERVAGSRDGQAWAKALERYVPAAVTRQLRDEGAAVEGEAEVSVLFVDIRGYTALSETRAPEQIFSMISAYTKTVSRIVAEHGGAVVDFSGDGLMAVFGAPTRLAQKERRAVSAARTIAEVLAEGEGGEDDAPVEVGIGVATGEAHVGTIDSADRSIWCVLGNTTNLAARLQSMTRTLDATVLIDERTREAAPDDAFRPLGPTAVRGRSTPLAIHAFGAGPAPSPLT